METSLYQRISVRYSALRAGLIHPVLLDMFTPYTSVNYTNTTPPHNLQHSSGVRSVQSIVVLTSSPSIISIFSIVIAPPYAIGPKAAAIRSNASLIILGAAPISM